MKQKIIVAPQLGLAPQTHLGGEVYDVRLLSGLADRGWKIHILLPKDRPAIAHKNIIIDRLPIRSVVPPHLFNFFVYRYLRNLYTNVRFDIIRLHNPYFVGPGAAIFRRRMSVHIPIVASYYHLEQSWYAWSDAIVDRRLIGEWDAIVTLSSFTREEIHETYGVSQSKIHVFSVGPSRQLHRVRNRQKLRRAWGVEGKHVLLFLGRFIPRKNPGFVLGVLHLLPKDTVLIMAGCGWMEPYLRLKARFLGIADRVFFPGFVEDRDIETLMSIADLFLFPSYREGFGFVVLEALQCRTVPIAHDSTGIRDTIRHGVDGYLLPLSPDLWAEKILFLLQHPMVREKFARAGMKKVRMKFSWQDVCDQNDRLFRHLVERGEK